MHWLAIGSCEAITNFTWLIGALVGLNATSTQTSTRAVPPGAASFGFDVGRGALIKAAEDHETLAIWREAVTPAVGTNQHTVDNDNIMKPEQGDSRPYAVSCLKRERPELFADVVAGKLSANAAAIKAGFCRKPLPPARLRAADGEVGEGRLFPRSNSA